MCQLTMTKTCPYPGIGVVGPRPSNSLAGRTVFRQTRFHDHGDGAPCPPNGGPGGATTSFLICGLRVSSWRQDSSR